MTDALDSFVAKHKVASTKEHIHRQSPILQLNKKRSARENAKLMRGKGRVAGTKSKSTYDESFRSEL